MNAVDKRDRLSRVISGKPKRSSICPSMAKQMRPHPWCQASQPSKGNPQTQSQRCVSNAAPPLNVSPKTMISSHSVPTPCLPPPIPVDHQRHRPIAAFSGDLNAAVDAQQAKRAEWATLKLRQTWADAPYMREHLRQAGLIVRNNGEPATERRMKVLLRRVGIYAPEVRDSVGSDLTSFLGSNPGLPLWAAVAHVLEATGRFTPSPGV